MITKALTSSCHWKIPCTFLLAKENTGKRFFNTNSELSQNRTEKQIMSFKTTLNWLFHNILSYLLIGSFDLKIDISSTNSCDGFIVLRIYSICFIVY